MTALRKLNNKIADPAVVIGLLGTCHTGRLGTVRRDGWLWGKETSAVYHGITWKGTSPFAVENVRPNDRNETTLRIYHRRLRRRSGEGGCAHAPGAGDCG